MYRRNINLNLTDSQPNDDPNAHAKLLEIKNQIEKIKSKKNTILFKKFMDENIKYEQDACTTISDLRHAYKSFASNLNKKNLENIYYTIKEDEIKEYNKNFIIKNYSYCRGCKTRYRYNCCPENNRNNRQTKRCIINLAFN